MSEKENQHEEGNEAPAEGSEESLRASPGSAVANIPGNKDKNLCAKGGVLMCLDRNVRPTSGGPRYFRGEILRVTSKFAQVLNDMDAGHLAKTSDHEHFAQMMAGRAKYPDGNKTYPPNRA